MNITLTEKESTKLARLDVEHRRAAGKKDTEKVAAKLVNTLTEKVAKRLAKIAYSFNEWPTGFSDASQKAFRNSARQIIRLILTNVARGIER